MDANPTSGLLPRLLSTALRRLARGRLPQVVGELRLPGLAAAAEIIRDRWGVPHIYAQNDHDVFFAQGFVHAQDRLWQIDFHRRLVAGRLAEVLGQAVLPLDRWMRILGLRRVAEQETRWLAEEAPRDARVAAALATLEAYVAGVNAGIASSPRPIEFTLLRCRPEPWTIADSLSWAKMMAWSLSVNWESELLRSHLIARLGPELAAELEPVAGDLGPIILADNQQGLAGPRAAAGLGSNNWVVAGDRTTTGKPLLANDMHLQMAAPSMWYENHLDSRAALPQPSAAGSAGLHVTGVTFPGIPGVIAGHNAHVAWGFTNGFADVQDLYTERLRRTAGGRVEYEYCGQWLEAAVRQETIRVRGRAPLVEEVIVTRHGPIINALAPDLAGETPLALRWTSLDPGHEILALCAINRARTCAEFRAALHDWTGPVQNVAYADIYGDIGYTLAGRIPIRPQGDGRVPAPGWTGEHEWRGYIPFDELPHLDNPAQGYIVTANNRVVADDYPYFLGRDFTLGDRAQRITELIEARAKLDIAYVQRMQFDQVSPTAVSVIGCLGQLTCDDPELAAAVEMMRVWDGELAADSPAAAVQQVFVRRMIALMTAPRLGELAPRYAGRGPTPEIAASSIFGHRACEWLKGQLAKPASHWFDLGGAETRDDVMRLALRQTVDYLKGRLGPRVSAWGWGKLHTLTYGHVLGRAPALARLFNRGPYPLGGDGSTLWAAGIGMHDLESASVIGPPFRFIADLADWRNCLGLLAPGQSGNPASPHYDDQVEAWFTAGYHPLLWERVDVEAAAAARLTLS